MTASANPAPAASAPVDEAEAARIFKIGFLAMVAFFVAAPFVIYPVFLMKAMCFAIFACAFNLLIGYVGLTSFGHAAFLAWPGI